MNDISVQDQQQILLKAPFSSADLDQIKLGKVYCVEGDIPSELPIVDGARFLFVSRDQRALTHGLHKYPAKFFPELPRWLIKKYSEPRDTVLDPFMGSGTTNLEAMLHERHSIGLDVDPFSRMLARVKTTPLPRKGLLNAWQSLEPRIERYKEPASLRGVPDFPYRENWFRPFMLRELAYIKRHILNTDTTANIKNFFLMNFSSIRLGRNKDLAFRLQCGKLQHIRHLLVCSF